MSEEIIRGTLFVIGTPIGNLEDMTFRSLRVLALCDKIACEDTRVTKKLLTHYNIQTPTISYHQHSKDRDIEKILILLGSGKSIALVTDAGTPGISDPGNMLVEQVVRAGFLVVPIPGASALATAVSISGFDMQQFFFAGFPPHKKGRKTFFEKVVASNVAVAYYDSVHRVIKNLELLAQMNPDVTIVVARELTKMFESILRGKVGDIIQHFRENPGECRGEFVILVAPLKK
ncbi:MAG: 16S rRNA (cytidine(1402)-2'-O)-methyltransferase [Candidatus Moraniibacteriota bacterium]|nr:MAG: 16S rRNA (cytidine(1402)-2'-O)-methyltransferase [Candidatus Moranbacteria bacterium]